MALSLVSDDIDMVVEDSGRPAGVVIDLGLAQGASLNPSSSSLWNVQLLTDDPPVPGPENHENVAPTATKKSTKSKRKARTTFTDVQKKTLNEAIAKGLRNRDADAPAMQSLGNAVGLSLNSIKNYVSNNTRHLTAEQISAGNHVKKSKVSVTATLPTSFNLFVKDRADEFKNTDGQLDFVRCGKEWQEAKASGGDQKYVEARQHLSHGPTTSQERTTRVEYLIKKTHQITEELGQLGVDGYFLGIDQASDAKKVHYAYSSNQLLHFFRTSHPDDTLVSFLKEDNRKTVAEETRVNTGGSSRDNKGSDDLKELKTTARLLLNEAYAKFTGKTGDRFPYTKLNNKELEVVGLPAGVTLKAIARLGKASLEKLVLVLKENSLTFTVRSPEPVVASLPYPVPSPIPVDSHGRVVIVEAAGASYGPVVAVAARNPNVAPIQPTIPSTSHSDAASAPSTEVEDLSASFEVESLPDLSAVIHFGTKSSDINQDTTLRRKKKVAISKKKVTNSKKKAAQEEPQNDVFEIEELLDTRMKNKIREYQVAWVGYDDCTWEPEDGLPPSKISEFWMSAAKKD